MLAAPLILPPGAINIRAQLSTGREAADAIPPHGYVVASKEVKGSNIPGDYTFVLTRDEIYVPILVRKPKGNGPFPAITMGWGEGREGMKKVEQLSERLAQMQDRMIARGYVVVTVNYRNEVPYAYESSKPPQNLPDSISGDRRMLKSGPTLDHEDLVAIIKYLQTVPHQANTISLPESASNPPTTNFLPSTPALPPQEKTTRSNTTISRSREKMPTSPKPWNASGASIRPS